MSKPISDTLEMLGREIRARLPQGWQFALVVGQSGDPGESHVWIDNSFSPAHARELLEEAIEVIESSDSVTRSDTR